VRSVSTTSTTATKAKARFPFVPSVPPDTPRAKGQWADGPHRANVRGQLSTLVQPQRAPDGAPLHYERHRPEQTTLYRLVQQHAASFIAHTEASTGSERPRFVKDEFDAFLEASWRTGSRTTACACPVPGARCFVAALRPKGSTCPTRCSPPGAAESPHELDKGMKGPGSRCDQRHCVVPSCQDLFSVHLPE
jgi:hypothetical protein